jgi:parallel beta-helix repeat protein
MSTPDRFATRRWIPVLLLSEVLAVAVLGGARLEAATIYVSTAGNDGNSGLSWAAAKKTVQAGLNAAASGDQVWVAKGTYLECITLKAGVSLYGGFAGGETDLAQRNRTTNVTILDGNQAGSVVTGPPTGESASVNGFTIRNGLSTNGGGIYCVSSHLRIYYNTITGNTAANDGGGIYCGPSGPASIDVNTITGNSAGGRGGGVCLRATSGSVGVKYNTITGNRAAVGGGIYCTSYAPIYSNTIVGNNAINGGGICCDASSSASILSNNISGNSSSGGGGGILYQMSSSPIVVNNTITLNSASYGGGIWSYSSSASTVANNIIALNSSGIHTSGGSPALRKNCVYGNADSNYSGLPDQTGINGNISADPKLAGVLYGNIHIQPDSPCRDAGDDSAPGVPTSDFYDKAQPQGVHIDIGAAESDGTTYPTGPAMIVRVSPTGNDANNGSSWALAKRTIQAALDAAAAGGGEVWAREGVYTELITLRPYGHLFGGFAGTETLRAQRNWASHPTVLDGNHAGSVVKAIAGYRASTIDGLTIRNGGGSATAGGGIYCNVASPFITNDIITSNSVSSYGGGIYCTSTASPVVAGCIIAGNSSGGQGGGIYCASMPAAATIVNSTIIGNSASSGGGLYARAAPLVANTIVAFNSSGLCMDTVGTPTIRSSCAYANTDYNYSGLADPTGTNGNISADPQFVRQPSAGADGLWGTADDDYGDLHLLDVSPCIDAGNNADVPADSVDLNGNGNTTEPLPLDLGRGPRLAGTSTPPVVDMGAYERCIPGAQHVWPAGNDANDGLTWATAKQTVRAGLNAAIAGEQVWVAAGTYVETIALSPGVALYGGFAGTETDLAQRNWKANETILDGNQAGSVVTASGVIGPDARLDGFTIRNGKAASGGGICCSGGSPTIVNNTVTANSATSTGGGIYGSASSMVVANNTVTSNEAPTGGGIYCTAGSPLIRDNLIARNLGGGVYSFSSSAMLLGNTIAGNTASQGGGGIRCQGSVAGTIANNVIVGNSAMVGGGIWCNSCTPMIANNTIIANSATGTTPYGGGILCVGSSPAIVNTIVNTLVAFNSSGIYRLGGSTVLLRCDCVYGNAQYDYGNLTDPTGTDGNISADPNFVRAASPGADGTWGTADDDYGDLRLPAGSPCIDAGRNADVPADAADLDGDGNTTEPLPLDLAGKARLAEDPGTVDTGSGTPPIVDIGAYEYVCAGDVDGDGHVDVSDLLCLVNSWAKAAGQAGFDSRCDQDGDGRVSILDLLVLVNHWGL